MHTRLSLLPEKLIINVVFLPLLLFACGDSKERGPSDGGGSIADRGAQIDSRTQTGQDQGATARTSYAAAIQPVLNVRCLRCHRPGKADGEYRVDTYAQTLKPGRSGKPAVTPYDPGNSLLWSIEDRGRSSCGLCWHSFFASAELNTVKMWINEGAQDN